jgi:putative redox protein
MTIRVVRDMAAPMRHEIIIGRNRLATDGKVEDGGEGSAPDAHDLFDAALGACKALTVLWYANHRKLDVQNIEVDVARDASEERAGTYRLSAEISITGNLTEAQRADLLRVAQKCPVHKLMTEATIEITTTLAP